MEAALEQYLLLAKSAQGKACDALIGRALEDAHTFVFGELIQAVTANAPSEGHLQLLKVFAYGTYADYQAHAATLPELTAKQLQKLKMLTLASLAARESFLPFTMLQQRLDISSIRELEDLIIDSIYENLIEAKIDHKKAGLQVFSSFGRDVPPEQVPAMLSKLKGFLSHLETVEDFIDQQIRVVGEAKSEAVMQHEAFQEELEREKENAKADLAAKADPAAYARMNPGFFSKH